MKNKFKMITYIIIFFVLSLVILITDINNLLILLLIFILSILFFITQKHKKNKITDETEKLEKENKIIINTQLPADFDVDLFKEKAENLYIEMQKYFSNIDYDSLSDILSENLYEQFKKQMENLEKNNKRSIRENIKVIDFKINSYEEINDKKIAVSIGVYEDKYTAYLDKKEVRKSTYEDYYEIEYILKEKLIINNLKLINCRTKKD